MSAGADLQTLCRHYEDGQYVLVFDTGSGQVVSDHFAACEQVDADADLELIAQYLVDRCQRTDSTPPEAIERLVTEVHARR